MITIRAYPAKGTDGIDRDTADVLDGDTFAYDREFALYDADNVTGSKTEKEHQMKTHAPTGVRWSFLLYPKNWEQN